MKKNNSIAIIDIGSNSLRTVVYDSLSIHPRIIFKDKFNGEFARGLEENGSIDSLRIKHALKYLEDLAIQLDHLNVQQKVVLATSAMRRANNADEFARPASKILKTKVNVISDEEEAMLSAYATIFEITNPSGIVADIGGGSLELSLVSGKKILKTDSLKIGYQVLSEIKSPTAMRHLIKQELSSIKWLKGNTQMYIIGGKWRKLAKFDMAKKKYPLRIISGYALNSNELKSLCKSSRNFYNKKDRDSILQNIASIVLEELSQHTKAQKIIFCSNSIREGFIYKSLPKQSTINLLRESCVKYVNEIDCYPDNFLELKKNLIPTKKKLSKVIDPDLIDICILLSECAKFERINFRPEFAFFRVLYAPIYGLNHHERILIAFAIYYRYETTNKSPLVKEFQKFLDKSELKTMKELGLFMKSFYSGL